ncbi:MAG: alpha-L-fucosidase, partial [Bacteroidales bacterium]|nr:alpha-L-fucosidase [Bacteroidales bacterium]
MKKIVISILFISVLCGVNAQKYEANWESLESRPYPQWFSDAKLGIFIHWGLYSVPAYAGLEGYGEWYLKGLMVGDTNRQNFQNRVFGDGSGNFQYADFTRFFKGELFRPSEWASLFRKSGAKYVVLVTKHHDGYCLWDSEFQPNWNSVASGPHRNIVAELTDAVRAEGLKMGFYYSLMEWNNPIHRWTVDPTDSVRRYVDEYMVPQFKELVSRYRPSLIFSDGDWDYSAEQLRSAELISWYYNLVGDEGVVNNRWGNGNPHGYRTPEYSAGITLTDRPWAECRGLGRSFGLNRNEPLSNYLSSDELIRPFCKPVAAGGGLTLNVGPAADGQIPLLQQERLLDLGKWLEINGEAIYGTRPFSHFYEMKDIIVSRNDAQINFDWKRNSPDPQISYDNFTALWNGMLTPSFSEKYTFEVETDDRVLAWKNKAWSYADKQQKLTDDGQKQLIDAIGETQVNSIKAA